ncbi:hypothetical protein ACFV4N_30645 [Actinosynnema sp. NPDC059797]
MSSSRLSWSAALGAAVAAVAAVAVACGAPGGEAGNPVPGTTATTTPVEAADGSDLAACADGVCEVLVTAPAELPTPADSGVEALRVESVGADEAVLTGRHTGNRSSGSCSGRCDASSRGGVFTVTLGTGSTTWQNDQGITLVAVDGDRAVVRLGTG